MLKQIKYIFIITLLAGSASFAQERTKDTLDTEVLTVVKPYTPTVADAFKIKENPNLDDETTTTKKEIKYNIFSIPVASTFTPAKGKAATVNKAKSIKLFDNYASLGVGSYTTILGEVYLNQELSRGENIIPLAAGLMDFYWMMILWTPNLMLIIANDYGIYLGRLKLVHYIKNTIGTACHNPILKRPVQMHSM